MPLPSIGQLVWGGVLNSDILNDEANIANIQTSLSGHEANNPADPHGDRAYTSALVTPIITGLNQAPTNTSYGLVQLSAAGKIPLSLVPVGAGLTTFIDAIPDFNVPINGTPASTALNQALAAANAQGGGIVWIGSGIFGLDQPLVIYQNTWLMCSPGAVFTRINPSTAPVALIQNYSFNIPPVGGNIRITGGYWNLNGGSVPYTGVAFSFADTTAVLVEDFIVVSYSDGLSPAAEIFGCTNVTFDNVSVYAPLPINPTRAAQQYPVWRIEELNVTNLPSTRIPATVYGFQECVNITVRNCAVQAASLSDSFGPYSCFTSFAGTKGSIQAGARHTNINVVEGCYVTALATASIELQNWQNVTVTGCDFNNPKAPYLTVNDGLVPGQVGYIPPLYFLYSVNSPDVVSPVVSNVTNTTVNVTIINQFTIQANDFIPGNTCYRHHHGGRITCPAGAIFTINVHVGTVGDLTDSIVETVQITMAQSHTNDPYTFHHQGFDCDSDGSWHHCGSEFYAPGEHQTHCSSSSFTPAQGVKLYVSHSHNWDSNSGRSCTSRTGNHERRKQ